jgi:hypothetical protein
VTSDLKAWLAAAGRVPLLTPSEELVLGQMVRKHQDWPGGPAAAPPGVRRAGLRARDRMIRANLRLVVAVAKRFQGRCVPGRLEMIDLLQEGTRQAHHRVHQASATLAEAIEHQADIRLTARQQLAGVVAAASMALEVLQ